MKKPKTKKNSPQHNEWDFWQTAKLTLENSNPKVTELAVNWDADADKHWDNFPSFAQKFGKWLKEMMCPKT